MSRQHPHTSRRVLWALATMAILLTSTTITHATVLKDLKLDDLVKESNAIVIGQVLDKRMHRPGGQGQIWTDSLIHVETTIKGNVKTEITVRQQGGRIGDEAMHISGNATLPVTGRVVLFLIEQDGLYYTVGMELGAFDIVLDKEGTQRVERHTTVPVAIQAPKTHIKDSPLVLGTADTTYQGARLSSLINDIQRHTAP